MDKLKILISGTQDDLQPEREAVKRTVRALGYKPIMAEIWGSQPPPSISVIREMIEASDIYLGIYGSRYGFELPDGRSITEFEYDEFSHRHPNRILIYVKDVDPEPKQAAFLERVQDFFKGCFRRPKFSHTDQLPEWLRQDLAQLNTRVWRQIRGVPEPRSVEAYLQEVAAQKPYILWSNNAYIDRTVVKTDDLFARTVARCDTRTVRPEKRSTAEPLEEALARERKLVLLGEPGMGKTTSLQHLAGTTANQTLASSLNGEIPIYVELKHYKGESELETLLARRVNAILRSRNLSLAPEEAESTRHLKAWLAQSDARFLLLLDGLNEVAPEHHTAVRGALKALLNSPHRLIISCREHDYDDSLGDRAIPYVLQGLQEVEIRDYLERILGDKGESLFYGQMFHDKKIKTLAANPLMLWLICIVAQGDPQVCLPINRGQLFRWFVAMMPRLRATEGIRENVPHDVVRAALATIGFELQERERLMAELGEVREWEIPTAGNRLEEVLAQAKDWRFLKSDGALDEPVEFLHPLFQEYFSAVHLASRIGTQGFEAALGKRPFAMEWHEVIVMLAGLSDRSVDLVKWLVSQLKVMSEGQDPYFLLSLIRDCWEKGNAVNNEEARTIIFSALFDVYWSPRVYGPTAKHILKTISDPHAIEPLKVGLDSPNSELRYSVAIALGHIRDRGTIGPLTTALLHDPDPHVRIAAAYSFSTMATIGDHQVVGPLITALGDTNASVRRAAASTLGFIPDPRAVEPLVAALHDHDREVAESAASTLIEIGAPAVEQLIAALGNPNPNVRWYAIDALSEIGDPRALPELDRIARADKNENLYGESIADAAREAAEKIRNSGQQLETDKRENG